MRSLRAAIAILSLLAVGCAEWTLVPAGRHEVHGYRVATPVAWSRAARGGDEIWTVDGLRLQALQFVGPVPDGAALFEARSDAELPRFRSQLAPGEVVDFVVDSLARAGLERVEARDIRPAPFGAWPGFRFALDFTNRDGLEMKGLALGAVAGGRLHLILYTGARLHYYDRHATDVERILESIETPGGGD